jgi:hypothetical protein
MANTEDTIILHPELFSGKGIRLIQEYDDWNYLNDKFLTEPIDDIDNYWEDITFIARQLSILDEEYEPGKPWYIDNFEPGTLTLDELQPFKEYLSPQFYEEFINTHLNDETN